MKLGKEGWVLRSRAARGADSAFEAGQTRTAERNLGTRSTKIESVSFRIATFRKALIKLDSQLPQRLMGCCACDICRRSRTPKSLSARTSQRGDSPNPPLFLNRVFTQKAFAFGRGDDQRSLLLVHRTTVKWGLKPVIFVPSRAFRADI
jgi:hypothetical protein